MARLTLRHRIARLHPFIWIGAAAVAAGLLAWPLGGWDEVELQSTVVPTAQLGETVDGTQFSIAVEGAELTTVHPDGFSELDPGWEWLILEIVVTNETDTTTFSSYVSDAYSGAFTIDDGVLGWGSESEMQDGRLDNGAPYLVDGHFLPDLQPALPTPLRIVFNVREGTWTAGDELVVGVVDRTKYNSTLTTGVGYFRPVVDAEVTVPVEQGATAPIELEVEP